ncbi:MAG: iron hydrogenase small subunit [Oscillospiraceae bacterium]|nr:iron hydrogenase small subunit [Oscillospiraceae bacterium]
METVNIKINNIPMTVKKGLTILEAAREAKIEIPTLCYLKEINEIGACRICVVEVKGAKSLVASCVYPVADGMEIFTHTQKVLDARKINLELLLSNHHQDCLACVRNNNCELQKLCLELGVTNSQEFKGEKQNFEIDNSAKHMYRDNNKCILCRRCVAVCSKNQDVSVIGCNDRGFKTHVGCAFEKGLGDTACVSCGQCIVACPTGALSEKDHTDKVWEAISDETKHVIVQPAPSVRVTLGEEFGLPIGTDVTGKLAAVLRRLGFDKVYDTDFAADLTIVEEANELIERIKTGGVLPMITSCSPGWINYMEHFFPEFIPNVSTCKSPQQMFGAIAKTWYAEKNNIDPKDIVVVSVMPCTAKKYEVDREYQNAAGENIPDVDISITTRELARMIKKARISFESLPDEEFDKSLGISTGAATIFGATGGVMEAALRTAVETLTNNKLDKIDFEEVRGLKDIKKASYKIDNLEIRVAVASGLANARKLLELVKSGEEKFNFIEIMACPGGCINGGGQPIQPASVRNFTDIRQKRLDALYNQDKNTKIRRSHENPAVVKIYQEYLEKPGSHKAHEILHTKYKEKSPF